ncbi:unnamed protein product [Linum trigynum]|uniref:Uncharacterized protein n=1 Tax=Linum trigynum TaxID=586398 RepID=A0AAV2F5R5_9ROSI
MAAVTEPPARGGLPQDLLSGQRRPPFASSSPNPKGDKEAQHAKKKAKPTTTILATEAFAEDVTMEAEAEQMRTSPTHTLLSSAWTHGMRAARRLFGEDARTEEWYVADSDSEDVAATMRDDGKETGSDDEDDPLFLPIPFSAAEERQYCRQWRSTLVVKVLGRSTSYTAISRRLNAI